MVWADRWLGTLRILVLGNLAAGGTFPTRCAQTVTQGWFLPQACWVTREKIMFKHGAAWFRFLLVVFGMLTTLPVWLCHLGQRAKAQLLEPERENPRSPPSSWGIRNPSLCTPHPCPRLLQGKTGWGRGWALGISQVASVDSVFKQKSPKSQDKQSAW